MTPFLPIKARGDYINGKFARKRRPDGEIVSVDPGDRATVVGTFPTFANAVDEALAAARAALSSWSVGDVATRTAALRRLQAQLHNRAADLALLLSREIGRPLWETRGEVAVMQEEIEGLLRYGLGDLATPAGPVGTEVSFAPLGVIGVISPYPQPALLINADAMAAIAVGCTVVCKPSQRTPASAQLYAEIVDEADFPKGVFNLVQGDDACGEALASAPACDGVLFSGSNEVARQIQKLGCAGDGRRVRTLAGGLSAAVVLDDANLDHAAYQIAVGALMSAGQRCSSTRRVIVDRRVADPLIERLGPIFEQTVIGHGSDVGAFFGPLIDEAVLQRYLDESERQLQDCEQVIVRGTAHTAAPNANGDALQGAYVTPTIVEQVAAKMPEKCDREWLGPLLVLCRATDEAQAIELAVDTPLSFAISVFSREQRALLATAARARGGVCIHNSPTTRWPGKLPLQPVGHGCSGPWGLHTMRLCSTPMVVLEDQLASDATTLPPGIPTL